VEQKVFVSMIGNKCLTCGDKKNPILSPPKNKQPKFGPDGKKIGSEKKKRRNKKNKNPGPIIIHKR